jgi:hypothetical protein
LSSTSNSIRTEAGALLILLTNDAPPHEQVAMCMGLESERILKFEEIIRADIAYRSLLTRFHGYCRLAVLTLCVCVYDCV